METETPESTAVVAVDPKTGEVMDTPAVGGMPIFRLEQARELRQAIDTYQAEYLRDEHYVFYASWTDQYRRKRKGFDSDRAKAETEARRHPDGRVEPLKKKVAYEILAMPLKINSEPLAEKALTRGCYAHQGAHPVYREFWKVSTPDGRFAVSSGIVAACEKISRDDQEVLFGGRGEHDAPATAQARAYVRAMKQLLGFGEPEPYVPGKQPATGAQTRSVPVDDDQPENVKTAWAALYARAREFGCTTGDDVHDFFKVDRAKGALSKYAQARADSKGISLTLAIYAMREDFQVNPDEEPPPPEPEAEEEPPPADIP